MDVLMWRNRVRNTLIVGLMAMFGLNTSCSQSCPEPTPCPACPLCHVPRPKLDAETREHLKREVMEEIHAEYLAQWKREWEEAQPQADALADQLAACEKALNGDVEKTDVHVAHADTQEQRESNHAMVRKRRPPIDLPPTQPIEKDERGLKIMRQAFSTQIVRRLPVDEREAFRIEDGSVFCFVEVASNEENERRITLKFTHSTGLTQSYELPIGQSPAWRTWSKLNLTSSMTGAWLCEVFNEEGVLLASKSFVVE